MVPVLIILAVIAVLAVAYINLYNGIVTARNRCDNAWQTIDAQLQRRSDLIPNLVETVKAFAGHETEVFEAVSAARAAVNAARTPEAKMQASDMLTGALNRLYAVAEAYPEIKSNANFLGLQNDLTDTENKISYARMSYNDCVMKYNNAIQTFPGSVVAGFGGYQPMQGFEASAAARENPQVRF